MMQASVEAGQHSCGTGQQGGEVVDSSGADDLHWVSMAVVCVSLCLSLRHVTGQGDDESTLIAGHAATAYYYYYYYYYYCLQHAGNVVGDASGCHSSIRGKAPSWTPCTTTEHKWGI